jgi:hypothetical protein
MDKFFMNLIDIKQFVNLFAAFLAKGLNPEGGNKIVRQA